MEEKNNPLDLVKAIELISVSKKYRLCAQEKNKKTGTEDFWALKDVSLDVFCGRILGIVGRNGAGKTTLLNIISGVFEPTQGRVISCGRILGLFNLGIGFQDEFTGRENVFLNGTILGASRKELSDKLNSIIEFSELDAFIDMPLGTYSQGMRLRLGFSVIANLDFDTLVIDEVLAVGDVLFQNKCFQRLVDFRRQGKTLVITTQSLDLIERFCDNVALLEHGKLLFYGNTPEGINKYRAVLNADKFFSGRTLKGKDLVENTKKWADDVSAWGQELGAKEVCIESVVFLNKFGMNCEDINSGDPLKIKVKFYVKEKVKDPHFGVAIFRNDGVYCYGPNTGFDNYKIPELKPGQGWFTLDFRKIFLAPGEYRVSLAIWDKNEALAFDYRNGCYKLSVRAKNNSSELLKIPFKIKGSVFLKFLNKRIPLAHVSNILSGYNQAVFQDKNILKSSVKLLDKSGRQKQVFMTNDAVRLKLFIQNEDFPPACLLWLGIFRDDGIYCQGIVLPLAGGKNFEVYFPELSLLPGGYKICCGVWDKIKGEFLAFSKDTASFRMVFDKLDHGTIYLKHNWAWRLP